jgi:hypothetical protein
VLEPAVFAQGGTFSADVRRIIVSATFHVIFDGPAIFSSFTNEHILANAMPIGRRMTAVRRYVLVDRNHDRRNCVVEAFDTKHQTFLLIRDGGRVSTSVILKPGSTDFSVALSNLR